ncbi:cadmium-translocating P-type ATPase [Chloroflexia bacterium SDU3-3]|nr:cadmium-translocating P-type ATPase [Chloroflexia bacterium SDU3-3]
MSATLKLNLSQVLPAARCPGCASWLAQQLAAKRGIEKAHIVQADEAADLCLHYDPALLDEAALARLAHEQGDTLGSRYRHELLALGAASEADTALALLQSQRGVLHASRAAPGQLAVAYDPTAVQRTTLERLLQPAPAHEHGEDCAHEGEHHVGCCDHSGEGPTFLPQWVRERWDFVLIGLCALFLLVGWAGESFLGMPGWLALVFYALAYVAGGYEVATEAVPGLFRGKFDTDVLMLAAAAGAAALGEWSEGAFLLLLFSIGHAGEHYALDRARSAVSALGQLMPQSAQVRRGGDVVQLPIAQVAVGDVVVVRPGDRIPVDGVVLAGQGNVDQAPITGESVPVAKQPGERVFAGTISQDGALDVQVDTLVADSTLSRVMRMVAEAQQQTSPTQQFAQRFSAWFVPAVLIATGLVAVVPWLLGWWTLDVSFYRAMVMLVAASPCALAIGTPAAVLAGIGQAARSGVLIKGGAHLENLGQVRAIAFDKTGTLTTGQFAITELRPAEGVDERRLLEVAAAVEQQSSHPLAQAVVRAARERGLALPAADGLANLAGRGVRSSVGGQAALIGTPDLLEEAGVSLSDTSRASLAELAGQGRSTMLVALGGRELGLIALADTPRPGAAAALGRLRALGVRHLIMLTGDNARVARQVAEATGITDTRADLLPEDKLTAIGALGRDHGQVAMVGDGVNDAPALARATVGIAMGGAGTAVALETADVALMGDDIGKLPFAVGLGRASNAIIRQNLAISLGVIAVLLVSSVFGLVTLGPAVILHEGSTIVVVLNAIRLLGYRLPS